MLHQSLSGRCPHDQRNALQRRPLRSGTGKPPAAGEVTADPGGHASFLVQPQGSLAVRYH